MSDQDQASLLALFGLCIRLLPIAAALCVTPCHIRGPLSLEMFTCKLLPRSPRSDIVNAAVAFCGAGTAVILDGGTCTSSCVATDATTKAALCCSSGSLAPAKLACAPPCIIPSGVDNAVTESGGPGIRAIPHSGTRALSCAATVSTSEATLSCGSRPPSPAR